MARRSNGESVLRKHLRVLDAFTVERSVLSLSEIARATGLPVSTAHRITQELLQESLLDRNEHHRFRLGTRFWEYAMRTPGTLGLLELARPWINAVQHRIGQHTQLSVLRKHEVLFLERLSAPHSVIVATIIGGRIPLPLSASGVVLLSHASPELVEEVIDRGWPLLTSKSPRDGTSLRKKLRLARTQGYAVCDGYIHEVSRGIAVPVMGKDGVPVAGLSVVTPRAGESPGPIIELLLGAARGISRALSSTEIEFQSLLATSRASAEHLEQFRLRADDSRPQSRRD